MNPHQQTGDPGESYLPGLIGRCQRNEEGAFRRLVEEHQNYVFSLAFRVLRNEDDARDVVQETFIRVWKHLPAYDQRAKFTTWLYTITVRLASDLLKSRTRRRRWLLPSETADGQDSSGATEEERNIVNRDLAANIKALAGKLPPKQQQVFVLRDIQDLTVDEVGQILSMSTSSVKTNLCYARRCIRTHMQQLDGMEGR